MKKAFLMGITILFLISGCKKEEASTLLGTSMTVTKSGTGLQLHEVNIFSPNLDGNNDLFTGPILGDTFRRGDSIYLFTDSVRTYDLKIYKDTTLISSASSWGGSGQQNGVYSYEADYYMLGGGTAVAKGFVRLWRDGYVPCGEVSILKFGRGYQMSWTYDPNGVYNEHPSCR